MKRRNFLMLTGLTSGACLIPATIARRIHQVCIGESQPLILAPDRCSIELCTQESCGGYLLHLGNPEDEPEYPTLGVFLDTRGYNPNDDDSLREYLVEWRSFDENDSEEIKEAIESLKSELDDPIDDRERDSWDEWEGELTEGTLPRAYHYLSGLPLDDGNDFDGMDLGSLSFVQGDHPGSNLTYVEADSLAAIASLQHRLNKLNTGARIIVD